MTIYPVGVGSYPVFRHPARSVQKLGVKNVKRFHPSEFKRGADRVRFSEIDPTSRSSEIKELDKNKKDERIGGDNLDEEKWLNQLYSHKISYGQCITMVQTAGYTEPQSTDLVDQAIYHSERSTDWAVNNEKYGNIGEKSILAATLASVADIALKHLEENGSVNVSPLLRSSLNVTEAGGEALRGYKQYENIYGGRIDDDRAVNKYEAEEYGNKVAGIFSDLAYTFETKINPVALVALTFTNKNLQEALKPLLSLMSPLWWRIRMPGEINHEFATDLFAYFINQPLALLKVEECIKKVKEIKERGNLTPEYIGERFIELIGLDPKEHNLKDIFPELSTLMKNIFGKDNDKRKDASVKLGKFLAPILGFYGFLAYALGTPVKSILSFLEVECKWLNSFVQTGGASQQMLYLFRLMLPEQLNNQLNKVNESSPEFKELKSERDNLFYTGVAVCASNVLSTGLKLWNPESSYLRFGKEVTEEIADKGVNYYFSKRRKLLGKKHRLDNPELYNLDGTPKIVSDKVKIEDEKELAMAAA